MNFPQVSSKYLPAGFADRGSPVQGESCRIETYGCSFLQLDLGTIDQVVRCANLPLAEVANAVRLLRTKGCLELVGDRLRIRTLWYRAVVRSLRRSHLLPDAV